MPLSNPPIIDPTDFYPCTIGSDGRIFSNGLIWRIDAAADEAGIAFFVPPGFGSIVKAVVVYYPLATALHRLNYGSNYGVMGAAWNTHSETLVDQDTADVTGEITEKDVSGILTALAAEDHVSLRIWGDATNVANVGILGMRFKY